MIILLFITLHGCGVDDVRPMNALTDENVIRDEATAQMVLNSAYAKTRGPYSSMAGFIIEFLGDGLNDQLGAYDTPEMDVNDVAPGNQYISNYYAEQYQLANQTNWFISLMEQGKAAGISEQRKNEMISEAKCLRALAHFNLLRLYGQFYDQNSAYGIVLRINPAAKNESSARSSVKDTYASIVSDLKFAAENGRSGFTPRYASRTTAAAMLAKVYLYMGEFEQAAAEALNVINNTDGYDLETEYADIFTKRFDSRETFFAPFVDGQNEAAGFSYLVYMSTYSQSLAQMSDAAIQGAGSLSGNGSGYDPRFSYVYADNTAGMNQNGKYPFPSSNADASEPGGNTVQVLRMAEIYLIYAEAKARMTDGVDADAVARVNEIRKRAGADLAPIAPVSKQELLMAIYREKLMELVGENGEHWFDIVRYDRLGNQAAASVKPTVNNINKLIMPIPQNARAGNKLLTQNPGYKER